MRCALWATLGLVALAGCRSTTASRRTYEIRGQVLELRSDVREVRLAHEDIPGYMPPMSMSFGVRESRLLHNLNRGDLIEATLVVTDTDAWLSAVKKTGHAPVLEPVEVDPRAAQAMPELLEPGQTVPGERFTDQNNRPFALADARGQAVALTFIYTRCPLPTFCPLMDRNFATAQKLINSEAALRGKVLFLSISFDPAFDTPAVMRQHATSIGADLASWKFLTSDIETTDRFATRFGVSIVRETDAAPNITHNLRIAVIDPDGALVKVFSGGEWTAELLVAELRSALSS